MHSTFDFHRLFEERCNGESKIPVGISSCLVGDRVRYDGDHAHNAFIANRLAQYLEFKKFCPELEIGLGVPREPIQLKSADEGSIRCVQVANAEIDVTDSLLDIADQQDSWHRRLCGYIFKSSSPSCGLRNVKIWNAESFEKRGTGIYAQRFIENFPDAPVIDEDKLGDQSLCEDFLYRVIRCWNSLNEND